ncbi:hypothetical protein OTK49_03375 [Vibrio coralliirubri]|uniref:hypothetical protein n=1 Tax=Vibrio coralliirubri TaxID=1516159 RepID=UPI0022835DFD|nr:hypothetical protein [Vibrio coralliirubri]MCY9861558.1 hypothetical protein [Vibrio coralliirubri]
MLTGSFFETILGSERQITIGENIMPSVNLMSCKEVTTILNQNTAKALELLFKTTGGGVCVSSFTDILIEAGVLSQKTRTSWFGLYQAMSFEDYVSNNGILAVRIPNGMKFSGVHFTDPSTGFKATMRSMIMLCQLATTKNQVSRVLMGLETVSGYSEQHNYSSVNSVTAQFNKYFGSGLSVIEKLKHVSVSSVPEFISLTTTKEFWRAYLNHNESWQKEFLLGLEASENKVRAKKGLGEDEYFKLNQDTVEWLMTDSEAQRQSAKAELIAIFTN